MHQCKYCSQRATIHLTDIIHHTRTETHLCEECAREKKIIPDQPGPQFNLQALIQLVMVQHSAGASKDPLQLSCPECGIKYGEFRTAGRLGCAHDYAVFEEPILHLVERIHRGTEHKGKTPLREASRRELMTLREQLASAVAGERYEEAVLLRDQIRRKEGSDELG
jgi:protein arginine kinase activator